MNLLFVWNADRRPDVSEEPGLADQCGAAMPSRLRWRRSSRRAVLSALFLLLTLGTRAHPPPPTAAANDPKAVEAAVERAIGRVYPALVQIHVVRAFYENGRERKSETAGSGVILSPEGHVITNHHVAGKATAIRCVLSTKEEFEAKLVGTDALADIAILKLDLSSRPAGAPPLPSAGFGNTAALKVGDSVLAMGCPLALSQSVTRGIVANKDMIFSKFLGHTFFLDGEEVGSLVKWIAHDAQIQPGNSGGPLVNMEGEIVGINEIGIGSLGGAIPSDLAKEIARELIERGKVRRAWLGASFQPLLKDPERAGGGERPDARGVLLGGVLPGGPADTAGLRAGDVLLAVDGTPVKVRFREEMPAFNMLVASKPVGSALNLKLARAGKEFAVAVQTEARDDARGIETESKEWGLVIENMTTMTSKLLRRSDKRGVLVHSVQPGGPANQAIPPLAPWDVILEIGGKPVEDKPAFLKLTASITEGKASPAPTMVMFERRAERILTLVEVGIRTPQDPTQEARKAWLAVATQVLSRKLASALGLSGKKGVRLSEIYPESTAVEAGLRVGDILTHIDGNLIEASEPQDSQVFETMLRAYKVGSKPEFTVIRDGQPLKVAALLIEQPKPEQEMKLYESVELDFKCRDVSFFDRVRNRWGKTETGAMVAQVEPGGWAAVAGLAQGDLIQEVNGRKIAGIADLEPQLKEVRQKRSKHIVLLVKRGIHTLFLELEPVWPKSS
ncbi:MAG: PDZ domain-containing protein [Verrucomicrobia bacterium]|nr:PDZ domain-containing protein [Verrucomicrobiota bacterium]